MSPVNFSSVGNIFNTTDSPLKQAKQVSATTNPQESFATFLKESIQHVNDTQIQSDRLTEKLALGEAVDLHEVMITAQKASITMQTTIEVRNKVIESYQEIMRMQM